MNILFINSFDCSPANSGGVNRVVYLLTRKFMEEYSYRCYLGFFEKQPSGMPLAEFSGRIQMNSNFNCEEFESFLVDNSIEIVQINFLKKENLNTIPLIYSIARKHNVKVLYCLHVCPGFETVTYGSSQRLWYSIFHRDNPLIELKRRMITIINPITKPFANLMIRNKYLIPYKNCDKVVLLSSFYTKPYLKIVCLKEENKFTAIGNALTFKEKASIDVINQKKKEVLVVARFDEFSKRISLMLKIWREIEKDPRLDDYSFKLVGNGEAWNFYQHLVKKWNLKRVHFTGHQNPLEHFSSASIFLMTSSAEGWPMTLMEASQMGLPTIAFDSFGALHDIIKDGYNGFIVPNNNIKKFSNALTHLMLDEEKRKTMAINAVVKSSEFEIDKIVRKWIELFNNL